MRRKILTTVFVFLLALVVGQSHAELMGTAFTYQGQLYDEGYPADGLYDFAFKLYDANSDGNKVGADVNMADADVNDGYFTVKLDFGSSVFDGNARWLEIGVRQGVLSDPNVYTALSPRQEITPAPHAIYAESSNWNNLIDVPSDIADGDDNTQLSEAQVDSYVANNGYVSSWGDIPDIPADIADGDDVGGGLTLPYSGNISTSGNAFYIKNTGSGNAGYFEATGTTYGWGLYGGTSGGSGTGVFGEAWGSYGHGVYGSSSGSGGEGVHGFASNTDGTSANVGGYFEARGGNGRGVYGSASNNGDYTNYGGYFRGYGTSSRGVFGWGKAYDFYAGGPGTNYGPFTGAHEVKLSDNLHWDAKSGMIVSVTGEVQARYDDDGVIAISSTLPTVKLSEVANDKAVFGVFVAESPLPKDHWYRAKEGECFATVNALGEGRVWVCNINGKVEVGDYITTSAVPGYGQKQYDDLLRSCTLGKAIETVDWDSVTETIEFDGRTYKIYLIAVVYTSG